MTVDTAEGQHLESVATPALVLNRPQLMANVARLKQRMSGLDADIRVHLKTVKSHPVAALALTSSTGPAAVSTLKEAEEFGGMGVTDLLYAVCLDPGKLDRVTAIRRSGIELKIVVDSLEMAEQVSRHSRTTGDRIPTLVEIDVDGHRSGIYPTETGLLVEIGKRLQEGAQLTGLMTHAGESYSLSDPVSLLAAAERERAETVQMAERLRSVGLPCPIVSVGSTPTVLVGGSLEGITEVRSGVYMFFDLYQCGIGVCRIDEIALSVVATVVGHKKDKGWFIVDAGWMAMSRDRGTAEQAVDQYYGLVCDLLGNPYEDLVLLSVNQEHGIVAARPGTSATLPQLRIGDRVRVLPNHACATAAQHDQYLVVDAKGALTEVWPRFRGW